MSLIGVYLLAKTLVFRNEHFQHVFKTKTTSLKIWAKKRRAGVGGLGENQLCPNL
jgi:hypothetical protein